MASSEHHESSSRFSEPAIAPWTTVIIAIAI
jgi:hypothetical protein